MIKTGVGADFVQGGVGAEYKAAQGGMQTLKSKKENVSY